MWWICLVILIVFTSPLPDDYELLDDRSDGI